MARPGLLKHRKFIRLSRILRSRYRAYGVLGLLWEAGYESGEPIIGDATDVEAVCDWDGEPDELVEALQSCGGSGPGFIVQLDDGRFEVHDFWTHAPTYVRRRAEREVARQKAGMTLSEIRSAAGRLGAEAKRSKRQANGRPFATPSEPVTKTPNACNSSNSQANGKQVASTPNSQHPKAYSPAGLLGSEPVRAAAVNKKKAQSNFSNTAAAAAQRQPSANFEGTEDQTAFMDAWNHVRRGIPGMGPETLTAELAPSLQALLDHAHAKLDAPWRVLSRMAEDFHASKMSKQLATFLHPNTWPKRFDDACADVAVENAEREADRRRRRY